VVGPVHAQLATAAQRVHEVVRDGGKLGVRAYILGAAGQRVVEIRLLGEPELLVAVARIAQPLCQLDPTIQCGLDRPPSESWS